MTLEKFILDALNAKYLGELVKGGNGAIFTVDSIQVDEQDDHWFIYLESMAHKLARDKFNTATLSNRWSIPDDIKEEMHRVQHECVYIYSFDQIFPEIVPYEMQ